MRYGKPEKRPQLPVRGSYRLLQMSVKEVTDLVKGNDIDLIIEIGMDCIGDDHQLFVFAFQFLKGIFAEITGMCFFTVDHQHRAVDFFAVT